MQTDTTAVAHTQHKFTPDGDSQPPRSVKKPKTRVLASRMRTEEANDFEALCAERGYKTSHRLAMLAREDLIAHGKYNPNASR